MERTAKIIQVLPEQRFNGKNGEIVKNAFVVEWRDNGYTQKLCLEVIGEDKFEKMKKAVVVGNDVLVKYEATSREWQGKWFTSCQCFYCSNVGGGQTQPSVNNDPSHAVQTAQQAPAPQDDSSLPFLPLDRQTEKERIDLTFHKQKNFTMNENFNEMFDNLSVEEKSVLVVKFLKSISDWDFKRILCNVLDVLHYMDDEGLRKATESIINVRLAMEKYNWIKAYYASQNDDIEHEVFVRQEVEGSETFVDDKGNIFHISELDLTRSDYEHQIFNIEDFEKRNKEINQQYQESQAMYMEMLSKMDANAIADHKAKIDEHEYWRKLRGETFASLRKEYNSDSDALKQTEFIINRLYEQEHEFFKDK